MTSPSPSPIAVREFHERADTDSAQWAIHHTLGRKHNQAAPGDHKHPEYEGAGGSGEAWFTGSGVPAGSLGEVGDFYLNNDNGDYYEKTAATTWTLRGNLKGPQGAPGNPGSDGADGEKWFTDSGVPDTGIGIIGDWYLDSDTGDYYEKTATTTWTLRGNLRGPQGPPGQDATSENVLTNPSFEQWNVAEDKPIKWGTFWASTPRGVVAKGDGRDVTSAKWIPASTPGTNGYQRYETEDAFPIVPGEKWYFAIWARAEDAANPPNLILDVLTAPHDNPDFFVADTTIRNVVSIVSVATTAWVLYEGTLTIPAGEIYARMVISLNSSDGSALRIGYLDQAVAKSLTPSPESLVPYPTYNALAGTVGTTTPATPLFGFPIPEFTDAPDVPTDLSDLANAIETIIDRMCPPGVVKFYTGTTEPTGWLFCNGQAISRTAYPRLNTLAAAVSYASPWGSGDGSTTFNVPDANRRLLRGTGSGSALGSNDSQTEANRTLQHTHSISLGGAHNHGINSTNHTGAGNTTTGGTANRVINIAGAVDGSHNHGGNTDQSITHDHGGATGQNTGVNNIPHITMNVIIKT